MWREALDCGDRARFGFADGEVRNHLSVERTFAHIRAHPFNDVQRALHEKEKRSQASAVQSLAAIQRRYANTALTGFAFTSSRGWLR